LQLNIISVSVIMVYNGWYMLQSGFRNSFMSGRTKRRCENPQLLSHQPGSELERSGKLRS